MTYHFETFETRERYWLYDSCLIGFVFISQSVYARIKNFELLENAIIIDLYSTDMVGTLILIV